MVIMIWIVALVALLVINAAFVLAEFSIVKVRPSRIQELKQQGDQRAALVEDIQRHLDEYLGVCQVGITFASIALGMVGKQLTDAVMGSVPGTAGDSVLTNAVAILVSLVVVSGSHIVLGEQVPKFAAVRIADRMSLWSARPLRICRWIFMPLLWGMNRLSLACLRLLGIDQRTVEDHHSEDELRILLEHGQEHGLMSFRRLLFMENVFDLGDLKVKDAMRSRAKAVCLRLDAPWSDNLAVIRQARYSRFPVLGADPDRPVGFVHVKDALLGNACEPDLERLVRPCLVTQESTTLEALLAEMQRRRCHVALVNNAQGEWTGLIAMEDIIEEIIGTVGDEFESEPPISLAEVLTLGCVVLGLEAANMTEAVRLALERVPASDLPMPASELAKAVLAKERFAPTYLGHGLALPHARLACIERPLLLLIRSPRGIPLDGGERAHVLFLLLTPLGQPRVHQKLQARIARLIESSDYVDERLRDAATAAELLEVIRTGEQASLD